VAKRFADTTALFEYHAGTSATRAVARAYLRPQSEVVTSEHVEREWKRILFHALRTILEAAEEEDDLSAAVARLGRGFGREPSQRLRALALAVAGSERLDVETMAIRARELLRGDASRRFRRTVALVRQRSECGLARARPHQDEGAWKLKATCVIREGICRHEGRIADDLVRWTSGAEVLRGSEDEKLRRMGETAKRMADAPRERTGRNCYGRTGDLAIAVDCEPDEVLVTTDGSFEVMAEALGFTVEKIPV
jgi:hypothetical protein